MLNRLQVIGKVKNKFPYRYRILIFLFFLILITYLDRICISLVGVRMKSDLNLTNEEFGWVVGAFALAYAIFEIPSGILGDKIGQRAVFIRIVLWWSLFTALTGAATGLFSLICVRFLFGMGESGAYPTSSAVISRWFPAAETARSMSSLFVGQNAGAAIAPLIVIPIAVACGWRASFFINGLVGVIWVIICISWFRNHPSEIKAVNADERRFIETNRRYLEHKPDFAWSTALKKPSLWALMAAAFCSQWAQYFFIAWMPLYLQEGMHFSEDATKVIVSVFFVIGIIGVLIAGFLSDWLVKRKGQRFGRVFLGTLGLCILSLCFFIAGIISTPPIVVASLFVGQLFYSLIPVVLFSTCVDISSNHAGTISGTMNFSGQVGAFFLAIIFGKTVQVTHSYNTSLFIISAVLISGGLIWLFVDPTRQITKIVADDPQLISNKHP